MPTTIRRLAVLLAVPAMGVAAAPAGVAAAKTCSLTPSMTEGPYYKSGSPRRENITADSTGQRLVITGVVTNASCTPIKHARLEFWQADNSGNYDNQGYRLRGHEFTNSKGRYRLDTVEPGLYPGRTRHIHVKVIAGGRTLTTQLYFPGESRNSSDGIFDKRTLLHFTSKGSTWRAWFNFAVRG